MEQRAGDKKPKLSDLRESGEARAGLRPRDLHLRGRVLQPGVRRASGEADLIIAKHRNGAVGKVTLSFQKEYPRFMNYVRERYEHERLPYGTATDLDSSSTRTPTPADDSGFLMTRPTEHRLDCAGARDIACRPVILGSRRYQGIAFER